MGYPAFFDDIPGIRLYDPLGDFLGAFSGGELEIGYYDCARLAGHSCPTVASAFLMADSGLRVLFPDSLPVRSQIKVEMKAPKEEGVTGVIAAVISYITGANDEGGFKGIGGTLARNDLLSFGHTDLEGTVRLSRTDTGASVALSVDTKSVPGSPEMMPLMQKALQSAATEEERATFQGLWQSRVKAMLLDTALRQQILTMTTQESL